MAHSLPPEFPDPIDFQRIFEASPSPYLILDKDSEILAANDAFLTITQTRREQIVGHRLTEIFPDRPGDQSIAGAWAMKASLDRVIETRAADTIPIQRYDLPRSRNHKDGSDELEEHYWSLVNTPVLDEYGEVACIIHQVEDVTRFVHLMYAVPPTDSMGQPLDDLETELFHRGRELFVLNERLRHANMELALLDRAKSEFFQNVSHEFRTPLTLLIGPLEQLLQAPPPLSEEQLEQLELAHRNALRMLKQVNTLLDFARIEAGRANVWYEPTDLAALTTELGAAFRPAMEQVGLTFQVDCPPLPDAVYVDREMWEKIILNLLSNAFKFTQTGGVVMRLEAVEGRARLTVLDTGSGIPEAELPRLFERFHRIEQTDARVHAGTGIGLVLVQDLVKLHGGTIQVESVVGSGTQVTVEIPMGCAHLPPVSVKTFSPMLPLGDIANTYIQEALTWVPKPAVTISMRRRAGEDQTSLRRANILVVDDNADMRNYLARLLSAQHEVQTSANGTEALETVRKAAPDLVITDIMLSGMTGYELLRAIREDPETTQIPVIIVSGAGGDHAVVEGLAAGADDYLVKPFKARELLARVATQLNQSAASRSERELRSNAEATRARLDLVLESVSDAVIGVSAEGTLTYINNRAARRTGKEKDELLGHDLTTLFPGDDGHLVKQCLTQVIRNRSPERLEHFSNTQSSWFETRIYPSPSGAVIFSADISQRKHVEQRLRDAMTRLSMAAGIAGLGFWEWDVSNDRVYFSPEWRKQLGYAEGELPNHLDEWRKRLHPDDRKRVEQQVRKFAQSPTPDFEIEYRLQHKDNSYRWLNARWSALSIQNGHATRLAVTHLDITAKKKIEDELRYVASHDGLTGLPNRLLLTEFAEHMLASARRNDEKLAVLFFDLDKFKAINDTYGHRIGDQVLKEAALRITHSVRSEDMVGRLGGDEFVAVIAQVKDVRDVTQAAKHALTALSEPYLIDQLELQTPPSIGIAFYPDDGETVDALIQQADLAMYHAKSQGGRMYQFVRQTFNQESLDRSSIETRMKMDLENNAFRLAYQPIFDAETGSVVSVEALLRWPGMDLAPTQFIPIADKTGLIHPLGAWTVREACDQLLELKRQGLPPIPVALNVSASQFFHPDFSASIARTLSDTCIDSEHIRLEISESTLTGNFDKVSQILNELEQLGIRIDVDEFGHGCSNLEHLSQLKVAALKVNAKSVSPALTETIVALGHNLGLDVVADRIETDEVLAPLRKRKRVKLQGFYLCTPVPSADFSEWYRQQMAARH
ncbi:MAG TPA: EAL domain-containing protein [Rhodocyclaceae bacterium]|nr:EAL domain-containing protein [Rhodocyclaceae bacterium]